MSFMRRRFVALWCMCLNQELFVSKLSTSTMRLRRHLSSLATWENGETHGCNFASLQKDCCNCCESKKAEDILVLDLTGLPSDVCDYFVICTGGSSFGRLLLMKFAKEGHGKLRHSSNFYWGRDGLDSSYWLRFSCCSRIPAWGRSYYRLELWQVLSLCRARYWGAMTSELCPVTRDALAPAFELLRDDLVDNLWLL